MELEVSKLQTHPKPYEISRLDSSQLFHSTQHKFICKSQLITGYFLSTEAGPGGGELVSL